MWILGGYGKPHRVLAVSLTRFIPIPSSVVNSLPYYVLPISSPYRVNTDMRSTYLAERYLYLFSLGKVTILERVVLGVGCTVG
jgi:hypothetical protein